MNKLLKNIFFILFSFSILSFGQNKQEKFVLIKYIDFYEPYNAYFDCDNFDLYGIFFDLEFIMLQDTDIINTFIQHLNYVVKDTIKLNVNTAQHIPYFTCCARIIIYNDPGPNDIICVGNKSLYTINNILVKDEGFINYIKELLNQVDYLELDKLNNEIK